MLWIYHAADNKITIFKLVGYTFTLLNLNMNPREWFVIGDISIFNHLNITGTSDIENLKE